MNKLCSIELLRNAVSRSLSADEEAALHAHLDHCESCCAQMEQLAGGEAWQREAVSLLSADELGEAVPDVPAWSEVDFAVEHLDPSDQANVLGQLGGYDVIAVIGRGGMGIVLKAFDRDLKRFVAIKVLSPHLAQSSADSTMATLRRIVEEKPAEMASLGPELPPWFNAIVKRLLAKDPAQRFVSASEVGDLLEVCLSHLQQPATVVLPDSLAAHSKDYRFYTLSRLSQGALAMFAVIGLGLLGMFLWPGAEAPDIAGKWTGERWGAVVLEMKSPGEYDGTYTETSKGEPGSIQLQWSAREGRFNGTWQEGKDCRGKVSVRRVRDEVRGAWTTSRNTGIETERPELAELLWVRSIPDAAVATPGIRVKLRLRTEKHSAEMLRQNISFDGLSIMGSGIKGTIEGKASDNLTAVLAHRCCLESFEESGEAHFDASLFVPQAPTSDGSNLELSQKRLDQMQEQGVEFWLDHHRDQLPGKVESGRQPPQERKQDVDDET